MATFTFSDNITINLSDDKVEPALALLRKEGQALPIKITIGYETYSLECRCDGAYAYFLTSNKPTGFYINGKKVCEETLWNEPLSPEIKSISRLISMGLYSGELQRFREYRGITVVDDYRNGGWNARILKV